MVIAGPGSGKTEIISLRVARILRETDTPPSSILCLTFTDSAATNMRRRLFEIMGVDAHKVSVHTFHSFGMEIIETYPSFFYNGALFESASEIDKLKILETVFEKLPHDDPLASVHPKEGFVFLPSVRRRVSELKRAGITPSAFHSILEENALSLKKINAFVEKHFSARISSAFLEEVSFDLSVFSKDLKTKLSSDPYFDSLPAAFCASLWSAVSEAEDLGKTSSLTKWKQKHTTKNDSGKRVFRESLRFEKLSSLANLYESYEKTLEKQGFFDFDDMIMRVVEAVSRNEELRSDLEERYLYISVDEFQDTNDAQIKLLRAISSNPVHEGRPNVMVVGDDDQAIFKFQGADISNILKFKESYVSPAVITMTENYRSTQDILDLAHGVVSQGEDRLGAVFPGIEKTLLAKNAQLKKGIISRKEFEDAKAEYVGISREIKSLLDSGVTPSEIAIIAREHKYLKDLIPFLEHFSIPYSYEKRNNVLEEPHVRQIITISNFVSSISQPHQEEADELLSEMLSYPFWKLERKVVWEISREAREKEETWLSVMLESDNKKVRNIGELFLELAEVSKYKTLEEVLDDIIYKSEFKSFYFSQDQLKENRSHYLAFLSSLQVFYAALREYKKGKLTKLSDLIDFVNYYRRNDLELIDHGESRSDSGAVRLLTAHKAKGLEFETVFILHVQENVWAKGGRPEKLAFPINLPIAPAGESLDDKIRLFFVALTRAKRCLFLTSHRLLSSGRESLPLPFLQRPVEKIENKNPDESLQALEISVYPSSWNQTLFSSAEKDFLKHLLENYKMSVTHLNNFLDIVYAGPQVFLERNLLRFPEAKKPAGIYGSIIHQVLEKAYRYTEERKSRPDLKTFLSFFDQAMFRVRLNEKNRDNFIARGRSELEIFYKQKIESVDPEHIIEINFAGQGVIIGGARLTGKIDKMVKADRVITVHDFKTGKAKTGWKGVGFKEDSQLLKYKRQLVFYKLLVENSRDFDNFTVNQGILEFIMPKDGQLIDLSYTITEEDVVYLRRLVEVVYEKIMNLDFPDVSSYEKNEKGTKQFENDLLEGRI